MAERKTYTAEDFKGCNGRRVIVEGVIEDADAAFGRYMFVQFDPDDKSSPDLSRCQVPYSAIVEILPEEIGVGDRVRAKGGYHGRVLAIDNQTVGIRYDDNEYVWEDISVLTLVERAG